MFQDGRDRGSAMSSSKSQQARTCLPNLPPLAFGVRTLQTACGDLSFARLARTSITCLGYDWVQILRPLYGPSVRSCVQTERCLRCPGISCCGTVQRLMQNLSRPRFWVGVLSAATPYLVVSNCITKGRRRARKVETRYLLRCPLPLGL